MEYRSVFGSPNQWLIYAPKGLLQAMPLWWDGPLLLSMLVPLICIFPAQGSRQYDEPQCDNQEVSTA